MLADTAERCPAERVAKEFADLENPGGMHGAHVAAALRNARKAVKVLEVQDQICNADGCPETIDGIRARDDLLGASLDRLSPWILNQSPAQR